MKKLILIMGLLLAGQAQARTFEEFRAVFIAFSKHSNPSLPITAARRHAAIFWGIAQGNWKFARRLAAMTGAESQMRLLAYLPDNTNPKGIPRTDALGCHYEGIAREAWRLGLISRWRDWRTSLEFENLKCQMIQSPDLGSWLVARAFRRQVDHYKSMDLADQAWATDPWYLETIDKNEGLFDRFDPVARRLSRPPRSKR